MYSLNRGSWEHLNNFYASLVWSKMFNVERYTPRATHRYNLRPRCTISFPVTVYLSCVVRCSILPLQFGCQHGLEVGGGPEKRRLGAQEAYVMSLQQTSARSIQSPKHFFTGGRACATRLHRERLDVLYTMQAAQHCQLRRPDQLLRGGGSAHRWRFANCPKQQHTDSTSQWTGKVEKNL